MVGDAMDGQSESRFEALRWIFDPLPPSGSIQGGVPTSHVFRPDLDTFVREVLQNSLDQKAGESVVVRFSFEQLSGSKKQDFLDSTGWCDLREHIAGAAEAGFSTISPRLAEGLQRVEEGPLRLLRVADYGTAGLTGGESEMGRNFGALCKNTLDTCADRPLRGGSYGLGKAVLWSFSSLSTVLFSSFLQEESQLRFRLFGRSELPYHVTGPDAWSGPGWYGVRESTANRLIRAVSAWDASALRIAATARLDRDPDLGAGTSILVLGFDEPGEERSRPPESIAADMALSVSRWFWPSMAEPKPRLVAYVDVHEDGHETYSQKVEISGEAAPFAVTLSAHEFCDAFDEEGDVARRDLDFRIPAKRSRSEDAGSQVEAKLELRARQGGTEDSPALRNTIALVRGAGMVVQYRHIGVPLSDKRFHGVLLAGLAHGEAGIDEAAEEFFRAAEPPSHTEWVGNTNRIRSEYSRGAQARLTGLWQDLEAEIGRLCRERIPETSAGPERLARMLRIGGRGGGWGGPAMFRVTGLTATLQDSVWSYEGKVTRQSEAAGPWEFIVVTWLAGETGKGDLVPVARLDTDCGTVSIETSRAHVMVPSRDSSVTFRGETRAVSQEQATLFSNTRIRIEVTPRMRGES